MLLLSQLRLFAPCRYGKSFRQGVLFVCAQDSCTCHLVILGAIHGSASSQTTAFRQNCTSYPTPLHLKQSSTKRTQQCIRKFCRPCGRNCWHLAKLCVTVLLLLNCMGRFVVVRGHKNKHGEQLLNCTLVLFCNKFFHIGARAGTKCNEISNVFLVSTNSHVACKIS